MKNFYATLVLLFIASLSFAQTKEPLQLKMEAETGIKLLPLKGKVQSFKSGPGKAWYNYVDFLSRLYSSIEQGKGVRVQSDTNQIVKYSTDVPDVYSYGVVQLQGVGQIFDFSYFGWADVEVWGEGSGRPDLSDAASFSIDSVAFAGIYWRSTEYTSPNVVDTLIVAVVTELKPEHLYSNVRTIAGTMDTFFRMYDIRYEPDADGPDVAAMNAIAPVNVTYYPIPLTFEDSAVIDHRPDGDYASWLYFTIPVEIDNITNKQVAVAWTFKHDQVGAHYAGTGTGVPPRPIDSLYHMSSFSTLTYADPDPSYHPWIAGTPFVNIEHRNNLNTSIYVSKEQKYPELNDPASYTYGRYNPTLRWVSNLHHQYIEVLASCADCEYVSVKNMENRNVTVRPNPATNNFTVDLLDNSTATIQLVNLVGQVVASQQVNGQTTATIHVSDLNSGVYMLKVMQNGKIYTSKVVVK